MSKSDVRQSALKSRRSVPRQSLGSSSAAVKDRVTGLPEFTRARIVSCYVSKDDEVQTPAIIQAALSAGKRVIVPRVDPSGTDLQFREIRSLSELAPGHFHVMEPGPSAGEVPLSSADLVLVPVVAWDERGNRIGYGKGYYDRALKGKEGAVAIGLALESQRYDKVPNTSDDASLDMIVTEKRTLNLRRPPK